MNRRNFLLTSGIGIWASTLTSCSTLGSRVSQDVHATGEFGDVDFDDLVLRFDKPASSNYEALPLGNGKIGALISGNLERETIHLNDCTLWSGHPRDYVNKDAFKNLQELRNLIFSDQVAQAAELSKDMMGKPAKIAAYQPFCDLQMDFLSKPRFTKYDRHLDLRTAISGLSASSPAEEFSDGADHQRETFVSHVDHVLCQRLSGKTKTGQTVKLSLSAVHPGCSTELTSNGDLRLVGQIQPQEVPEGSWIGPSTKPGLKFAAQLRVIAKGGTVTKSDTEIFVRGAREIIVLVSLATSFVNYQDISANPTAGLEQQLSNAQSLGFDQLRARHVEDYKKAFGDVELKLTSGQAAQVADASVPDYRNATSNDPQLYAFMFQLGRYLLIASSRYGGQAANLQGIWNERVWPWWGSKYTVNANLQMNYWLAGNGALPECVDPFLTLLEDVHKTGKEVARVHYNCDGFVFHHNTDLWRAATPVDGFWGHWPTGGAWLVLQAYDIKDFYPNSQALEDRLYPILRDSVKFFLDFLVEIPTGKPFAGCLATNPSSSPEAWYVKEDGTRGFMSYAPTMDIQILAELFLKFEQMSSEFKTDRELRERSTRAREKLPPMQISANGELQEWIKDYEKGEEAHRHISHLYALYPGTGISKTRDPVIFEAARQVMLNRGDDDEGGSTFKANRAVLWARLGDGERALDLLKKQLDEDTTPNMFRDEYDQFDSRIAGPAAIAEMLVQSHEDHIVLLPALPTLWSDGFVKGIRARKGISLEFRWSAGRLDYVSLRSDIAQNIKIRVLDYVAELAVEPDTNYRLGTQLQVL